MTSLSVDQLTSLFEIAKVISRESSLEGLIDRILQHSRPWLRCDTCSLFLPCADTGDLVLYSAQGGVISHGEIRVPMGAGVVSASLQSRETIKVDDVRSDPRFYAGADRKTGYETRALIAVPLLDGDVCRGVIEFINPEGRDSFSSSDVLLAEYFASLVSSALYRMEMAQTAVRTALMQRDLEIALEVQRGLLPKRFPPPEQYGGLELWGLCDPAQEVGGDLYDFFPSPEGKLFFLIGDVSGKGVGAGMFMAQTRTLMRGVAHAGGSPAHILEEVNSLLYPDNDALLFVTLILGCYDPATGEIEYAQAGHNQPILCSQSLGIAYEPCGGSALGPFPSPNCATFTTRLEPGDALLLYTDGVTEAMNQDRQLYGEDRLLQFARRVPKEQAKHMVTSLREEVAAFVEGAEQSDDITILVLRRGGAPQPDAGT
ncbi:MAG: PP2C family protein-serine/threonine phosphatase [Prochlorococcaceae cyanobacterium]|jgi:sigma-B regulation protein RsbU (phosphoserine phosphatase)